MNDKVYGKLEHRWEELGFEKLDQEEQEAIALFWLEAEVMNGGLHQYFLNSSGDLYHLAVSGLKRIGAHKSLQVLESASVKLGSKYPIERDSRIDILETLGEECDAFDAETDVLQDLPERFFEMSLESLLVTHRQTYA